MESLGAPAVPETEVELLQRAQEALAGSPARALALTREHASRFPGGAFSQEREVVAIDALLRLGQAAEARARGARFVEAYPGSAYRRRIEALLGP
jgi:outer membrane protein assembly factor BamD (BamD/ComL family)